MYEPFIIAEMSANHLGSLERAMRIVDAAADAGADAIKLQTWTPGTMCMSDYVVEGGLWNGQKLNDLYEQAHTPWEWHKPLFDHAKERGILAFSSVFDHGALAFLETIGCPIYKISSFELTDTPLIHAVAATGKPMIMSTGMATFDEIVTANAHARNAGCIDVTILKCTSAYPADHDQANLGAISTLQAALGKGNVGVSDHTTGLAVPVAATVLGAAVIEKHLTLSREDGGPDAAFSMDPAEFKQMVNECRNAYRAIQGKSIGPSPGERTDLRRSVYAAKDIAQGDIITEECLTTARPGHGMGPGRIHRVIGKTCNSHVPRGAAFHESMVG